MTTNNIYTHQFDEIELLGTKFHKVRVQELINFIVNTMDTVMAKDRKWLWFRRT